MTIQRVFRRHQQPGWVGGLARPNEPHAYDTGRLNVPASGRKARPGDGVYWNATANRFQVPTTDAQELLVLGIVAYDPGTVQSTLGTAPTTENSDQFIEYVDDDVIKVAVLGTFYLIAGGAVEYGNILRHQNDDYKWDNDTPTSYAELFRRPVECVSLAGADDDIIEGRIGYGRTF